MLFKQQTLEAIAKGKISLAFRRWQRPTVRSSGRLRTAIGELAILSVDQIREEAITNREAARAGYESKAELIKELQNRGPGVLYRIEFRLAGPDQRELLRTKKDLSDNDYRGILQRLKRYDASKAGPWTMRVLKIINESPEVRAADLARVLGCETRWFKLNVRKLKELGLTESLQVGYRLSPRGKAFLKRVSRKGKEN